MLGEAERPCVTKAEDTKPPELAGALTGGADDTEGLWLELLACTAGGLAAGACVWDGEGLDEGLCDADALDEALGLCEGCSGEGDRLGLSAVCRSGSGEGLTLGEVSLEEALRSDGESAKLWTCGCSEYVEGLGLPEANWLSEGEGLVVPIAKRLARTTRIIGSENLTTFFESIKRLQTQKTYAPKARASPCGLDMYCCFRLL